MAQAPSRTNRRAARTEHTHHRSLLPPESRAHSRLAYAITSVFLGHTLNFPPPFHPLNGSFRREVVRGKETARLGREHRLIGGIPSPLPPGLPVSRSSLHRNTRQRGLYPPTPHWEVAASRLAIPPPSSRDSRNPGFTKSTPTTNLPLSPVKLPYPRHRPTGPTGAAVLPVSPCAWVECRSLPHLGYRNTGATCNRGRLAALLGERE